MTGDDAKNLIISRANELGLTNRQLSDASGVPVSTVASIRSKASGRVPSYDTALRLFEALGIDGEKTGKEESENDEKLKTSEIIEIYEKVIKYKNRLIICLLIVIVLLLFSTILVIYMIAYDIMHAGVGWVT